MEVILREHVKYRTVFTKNKQPFHDVSGKRVPTPVGSHLSGTRKTREYYPREVRLLSNESQ